jgi:hypothetical protein
VTLRHAGRSMLVEPNDDVLATVTGSTPAAAAAAAAAAAEAATPAETRGGESRAAESRAAQSRAADERAAEENPGAIDEDEEESMPVSPMTMQDGIRAVQQAFTKSVPPPRWPMYVRQAKQYLRNAIENFDERKYGFASVVDLLRAAGKEGVLRVERDRHGAVRVFPGVNLESKTTQPTYIPEPALEETEEPVVDATAEPEPEGMTSQEGVVEAEPVSDAPIVDGEVTASADFDDESAGEDDDEDEIDGNVVGRPVVKKPAARKRKAAGATRAPRAPRGAGVAKPSRPRARKTSR